MNYECCQHKSGPDPDPERLIGEIRDRQRLLDMQDVPSAQRAYECSCEAVAKRRAMVHGCATFLCNPCYDAMDEHFQGRYGAMHPITGKMKPPKMILC